MSKVYLRDPIDFEFGSSTQELQPMYFWCVEFVVELPGFGLRLEHIPLHLAVVLLEKHAWNFQRLDETCFHR